MNGNSPRKNPVEWFWHASLLILGGTIALNVAIAYLRPILPWIVAFIAFVFLGWVTVVTIRWWRSRW
jgi:hypothetical protein